MGPQVTLTADVELFEGSTRKDYRKGRAKAADPKRFEGGSGTLLNTGIIHVNVSGGVPPTTTAVTLGGADIWIPAERVGRISPDAPTTLRPAGEALLVIDVHDAGKGASRQTYHEESFSRSRRTGSRARIRTDRPGGPTTGSDTLPQAELQIMSVTPIQAGYTLRHAQAAPGSTTEQITVVGGKDVRVTVGSVVHTTRDVAVDVAAGQSVDITVEFESRAGARTRRVQVALRRGQATSRPLARLGRDIPGQRSEFGRREVQRERRRRRHRTGGKRRPVMDRRRGRLLTKACDHRRARQLRACDLSRRGPGTLAASP